MKYEGNLLLQDILQGKLFLNSNYIICYGSSFPYWFLFHLGNYLQKKDFISHFEISSYQSILNKEKYTNDMFSENSKISLKKSLLIISISRDMLQKKNNIFLKLQNTSSYYIIYVDHQDMYLISNNIISYNLSTTFSDFKKKFLWHYYQETISGSQSSGINYFFDFFYENYKKNITLETFFLLLPFIILINKRYFNIFIQNHLEKTIHNILQYSIFDLSTFFFQKEEVLFFSAWKIYQSKYTIEFWVHFWIEELIYAQLYILSNSHKIEQNMIINKKTNRWFLKHFNTYIEKNHIQNMLLKLLKIDIFSKKYQSNPLIHLESFFINYFFYTNK